MPTAQNIVSDFENRIRQNLKSCGVSPAELENEGKTLGAAVSGGADSMSLLVSLAHILKDSCVLLNVINVNHNMREEAESAADSIFVTDFCENLKARGFRINVFTAELPRGLVACTAAVRKKGAEEAARFLRYKTFDNFAERENAAFICLAHNKNDALETLLMHFLQGASGSIAAVRGRYIRPLLNITRAEIETYLTAQNIPWRTDYTNFDEQYFRNKIRLSLVPLLNEKFFGWDTALLAGAARTAEDAAALEELASAHRWQERKDSLCMDKNEFCSCPAAVRRRLLYKAFTLLGAEKRIPRTFINAVQDAADARASRFSFSAGGLKAGFSSQSVCIQKEKKRATASCFFAIIETSGVYNFTFGALSAEIQKGKARISVSGEGGTFFMNDVAIPFCVRSRQPADKVQTSSGSYKSIAGVFSGWHIPKEQRDFVPLIQELGTTGQEIVGIAGSALGFPDWIMRG
ncbi:MAG: tRNA lysidine(34) synthetase TilS [Treponema sp.]